MKKNILMALLVSLALVLTGCGSGDFDIDGGNGGNSSISDTNNTDNNGSTGSGNVTSVYRFMNAQSAIVSSGGQDKNISVQLVDSDGVGVAGETVKIKSLPQKYGAIGPATAKTDASGIATFHYLAPAEISSLNGENQAVTFLYKNVGGQTISTNAWIVFSNQVVDPGTDQIKPLVVIPQDKRTIKLQNNSQSAEIAIKVFKNGAPYSHGSVKVQLPSKVLNGTDVGSFDAYEVNLTSQGIATFNYTGPGNLNNLISNGDTNSTFKFYHSENSQDKSEMLVKYEQPSNPHVNRNYSINVGTSGEFSMGIPNKQKTFTVALKAKDGNGNEVDLSNETNVKIHVETTNGTVAQILSASGLVDAEDLNVSNYQGSFNLQSKKLSGLVPLKVAVEFTDANGKTHKDGGDYPPLTTIVNVMVYSGPPTALSISYVSTGQDADHAKYIEKLAVSAVDGYGNKINTRPNITLGAIVGYAVDGSEAKGKETNETKRLYYGKQDIDEDKANGEISTPDASHKSTFSDPINSDVFQYVNAEGNNTDKLVVFGAGKNYEAMGKWDITKTGANNKVSLQDDYFGIHRSGLYYAVGHNYYQDFCRSDGREWIGITDSDTYQLDEEGTVIIDYKYDYHLTGKDALLWVNLDGLQPDTGKKTRIGEVTKHTLRGTGLSPVPKDGYTVTKGNSVSATFYIHHTDAPEWYRNGHFGWRVKSGSTCGYSIKNSSNRYDARTCNNGGSDMGVAYITFQLTAPQDKDCTFALERIVTGSEF